MVQSARSVQRPVTLLPVVFVSPVMPHPTTPLPWAYQERCHKSCIVFCTIGTAHSNTFNQLNPHVIPLLLFPSRTISCRWIFGAFGLTVAAASLAELCSACPTAGGLYFFTARLSPRRWAFISCSLERVRVNQYSNFFGLHSNVPSCCIISELSLYSHHFTASHSSWNYMLQLQSE